MADEIKFWKSNDVAQVWWSLSDTNSQNPGFAAHAVSLEKYECSSLKICVFENYI